MTRSHTGNGADERRVYDGHCRSDSYNVIQLDDVARSHSDASVARGGADPPFLWSAVNVNVPPKRVGILSFKSAQPKDPCHDRISTGRVGEDNFSSASPVFEYGAGRGIVTDLLSNL